MGGLRLDLCRASLHDLGAVSGLLREASLWLRTKYTDQWADDWPSEDIRRERVRAAIQAGQTWIAWDATLPAATITASPSHHGVWREEDRRDPAVYVQRLVVSRRYAGLGLGAQLLDWAGLRAERHYGARWIRVDGWTANTALHEYYQNEGFQFCGFGPTIADYPAPALFQKHTDEIEPPSSPLFRETEGHA